MSSLQTFWFEGKDVRFVGTAEKPEWVAADVCACLGLENSSKALSTLKSHEKGITVSNTPGGEQEMLTVFEPGLYRLIFKSRKSAAERFQDWVFHINLRETHPFGGGRNRSGKRSLPIM